MCECQSGQKKRLDALNDAINIVCEAAKRFDNRPISERPFLEDYCEGRAEVVFLLNLGELKPAWNLKLGHGVYLGVALNPKNPDPNIWRVWIESWKKEIRDFEVVRRGQEKAVLVDNIDLIQLPKLELPFRVRLKFYEKVDSLFAGAMYASLHDSGFKFFKVSVVPEWEGNSFINEFLSRAGNNGKNEYVQSGPQVMNSVPNHQGDIWGNVDLVFDSYFTTDAIRFFAIDDAKVLLKEVSAKSVEVFDVLYGPF